MKVINGLIKENTSFDYDYISVDGENIMSEIRDYLGVYAREEVLVKSLRFAISNKPIKSLDDVLLDIQMMFESETLDIEYSHAYSEYTGYLWTDEKLVIGGHDLLNEIKGNIGKYIHLEIEKEDE